MTHHHSEPRREIEAVERAAIDAPDDAAPGLTLPDKEAKRLKKLERAFDNARVLEPWERYRALMDLVDLYTDSVEIMDRKTRFAMVLMGALNVLNLLIFTRRDLLGVPTDGTGWWLEVYIVCYSTVSLYFFVHAIDALRPRAFLIDAANPNPSSLRFMKSIATQPAEEFAARWKQAQIGQLCEETGLHAQQLAAVNVAKVKAVDGVFRGLIGLTVLTAVFISTMFVVSLF